MNNPTEKIKLWNFVARSTKYFLLSALWLISGEIFSQTQMISHLDSDYPGGGLTGCPGSCVITLPPAIIGKDYSFTIPLLTSESGNAHTFLFDPPCDCSSGYIDIDGNTGEITMTANNFCVYDPDPDVIEFELLVTRTVGGNEDRALFRLPIVRRPFKLVFVLDISGSMSTLVQGSPESRWEVLKKAVNVFMNNLEADSVSKDQVGLTYFTDYLVQPADPMYDKFLLHTGELTPLADRNSTFINTDMGSRHPLARTSLGMGLQDAKTKLTRFVTTDTTRMIFLFTDGIQNEPPYVDPDGKSLASGTIPINDIYPAGEGSIKICVTEVESFPIYADMLQNLAVNNRGFYQSITLGTYNEMISVFQDQFSPMLKGYSPQMVARRTGLIQNGQSTETFVINGGVGRLHFQLTFNNGDSLKMQIEKDGTDVTSFARVNTTGYFQSLSLDMPLNTNPRTTSKGQWAIKVTGKGNKSYSLICIADDHFLDYQCILAKNDYSVGEPLKLMVNLKYNGEPLDSSANQVKAVILKPGEDLGHLLAIKGWDYHQPDSDVVDPATQKYIDLLRNDSTFYEALLPSEQVVILNQDSAGFYSGQYNNTDITGVYKVIFMMNGEIPRLGRFVRTETQSRLFKFAETSDTKTDVTASVDTLKGAGTITVRPMNKFNKYMGPGLTNWIKVEIKSEKARINNVKDNLDGSYTFFFSGLPSGLDPIVCISIRGVVFREKILSKIDTPQSTWKPWKTWQLIVLLVLIILLILGYLKNTGINKLPKWLLWILVILWLLLLVLIKLGILNL